LINGVSSLARNWVVRDLVLALPRGLQSLFFRDLKPCRLKTIPEQGAAGNR
jgi:hypothetical protein